MTALRASSPCPRATRRPSSGAASRALAAQRGIARDAYEVILVLDGCTDATRERALQARRRPAPARHRAPAARRRARRGGWAWASPASGCSPRGRLTASWPPRTPTPRSSPAGWRAARRRGPGRRRSAARWSSRASTTASRAGGPPAWPSGCAHCLEPAHPHFSGASIAVTAETYRQVGGLEPRAALEDEAFGPRARRGLGSRSRGSRARACAPPRGLRGAPSAAWPATSPSTRGSSATPTGVPSGPRRARGAQDRDRVRRRARAGGGDDHRPDRRGAASLRRRRAVDEVLVVDAASRDGTAAIARAAGATVAQEDDSCAQYGPCRGKGDAMWRGAGGDHGRDRRLRRRRQRGLRRAHAHRPARAALRRRELALVKGAFQRPFAVGGEVRPGEGGRVTELMARPLLNLHRPALAGFAQPLAGEIAARR